MGYLLKIFVVSLLLTELIELIIMYILREGSRKNVLLLILVNILTNPAAVFLVILIGTYFPGVGKFAVEIPIELLVVFVEAKIYQSFAKEGKWQIKRPVLLAAVTNTVSWFVGVML